ncbi:MAG TPA: PEP-CTERM sorting domain-containing protein [Bryobacteraceae bacterium]|nr:PEP-CTERM sorting domain-containing protein [Bryobacteraceae bacterium]
MRLGQLSLMGLLAVGSILSVNSAFADTVSGTANIAGSVTVTKDTIAFNPVFMPVPGGIDTGSFVGLTGGTVNAVLTGGPKFGAVDYKDFLTFDVGGTKIDFDLTYIEKGNAGDDSPFSFAQVGSNVMVGLSLDGASYYESSPGTTSSTSGVYSTQLLVNGASVADVIASVNAGNAIVGQSYSATFTASPTPEPASWLLMSAGLLGAGFIARRKAQALKTNA